MPRTAIRPRHTEDAPPTAASIITLVDAIKRHGLDSPAAIAFKAALRRKGIEADAAVGPQALDALIDAVARADQTGAEARIAIIRAVWADLMQTTAQPAP